MSASVGLRTDLSRKMQQDLGDVLDRNLELFRHVLGFADISTLMLEASVMLVRTSAATITNSTSTVMTDDEVRATFDLVFDAILAELVRSRESARRRTVEEVRKRQSVR